MQHDARAYLFDIKTACEHIIQFAGGISQDEYAENELIKSAVERKFVIIGEAMVRLRREYPDLLDQITDYEKIIGFRNVLVHGYDLISDLTVWSAIMEGMPVLLEEIKSLLDAQH